MIFGHPFLAFLGIILLLFLCRFLSKTSLLDIVLTYCQFLGDKLHVYQLYKVPQHNDLLQENQLYRKVSTYLSSLPAIEDTNFANLLSGPKSSDIILHHDANQAISDTFLSARVEWRYEKKSEGNGESDALVLRLRKNDKRRILRPYLQHILSVADNVEQEKRDIKLYMNPDEKGNSEWRWKCALFNHPATMDTMVMDLELKNRVKADLESFLKSKQYYHRLGRAWKRSYLLYGPPGTGKSSFIAAMAKFLCFDVYDIDISKVADDADLKMLLLRTRSRSMIVIEDLDRFLMEKSRDVSLSGVLNFMDGIVSSCGEERVMVFTMKCKDQVDEAILRPGRIDVHIHFPLCDFSGFKSLAGSCLGLKEHKLFPLVQEMFQRGASLSPAEISEIMISNRSSPSRALKLVMAALQLHHNGGELRKEETTGEAGRMYSRENGVQTMKEFRKLYGLLKMGSRRKESMDLDVVEKEG